MKTWLNKVTGETLETQRPVSRSASMLRCVLGEGGEDDAPPEPAEPPSSEPPSAVAEPPIEAAGHDLEAGETDAGAGDQIGDPVESMVALWTSGAKMDVASKLMTLTITYQDFARLLITLGEEGALELGQLLDSLAEQTSEEQNPEGGDAVLDRVNQHRVSREEQERRDFRERHAAGDPTAIAQAEQ